MDPCIYIHMIYSVIFMNVTVWWRVILLIDRIDYEEEEDGKQMITYKIERFH